MEDSSFIFWFALMSIASVVQTLVVVGVGVVAWRSSQAAQRAVERVEKEHLQPLMVSVDRVLTEVRHTVARARAIEQDVRDTVQTTSAHVTRRIWPAVALGRAAYAAFSSFKSPAPALGASTFDSAGGHKR